MDSKLCSVSRWVIVGICDVDADPGTLASDHLDGPLHVAFLYVDLDIAHLDLLVLLASTFTLWIRSWTASLFHTFVTFEAKKEDQNHADEEDNGCDENLLIIVLLLQVLFLQLLESLSFMFGWDLASLFLAFKLGQLIHLQIGYFMKIVWLFFGGIVAIFHLIILLVHYEDGIYLSH